MAGKKKSNKPAVNKELEGFAIEINPFGEISSNFPVERINEFLDKHVPDKKFDGDEAPERPASSKNSSGKNKSGR